MFRKVPLKDWSSPNLGDLISLCKPALADLLSERFGIFPQMNARGESAGGNLYQPTPEKLRESFEKRDAQG